MDLSPSLAPGMAADPVLLKGEWTFSATDLGAVADLAERLDRMAARGLSSPQAWERLMRARAETRGSEPGERYRLHYLDLADLGRAAELQGGDGLAEVGRGLADAVPSAVQAYGAEGFGWTSGLNLYAADWYLPLYSAGEGASWAEDTRWDEVLRRAEAQGR
jgi:hypothetical protein